MLCDIIIICTLQVQLIQSPRVRIISLLVLILDLLLQLVRFKYNVTANSLHPPYYMYQMYSVFFVSGEYELFTYFYVRLATVLSVSSLSHHLVSARILTTNEEEQLDAIDNSTDKATFVLRKIAAHLEGGFTESFHSLLSLIENHGDISSIQLVSEIKSGIISLTGNVCQYIIGVYYKFIVNCTSEVYVAMLLDGIIDFNCQGWQAHFEFFITGVPALNTAFR